MKRLVLNDIGSSYSDLQSSLSSSLFADAQSGLLTQPDTDCNDHRMKHTSTDGKRLVTPQKGYLAESHRDSRSSGDPDSSASFRTGVAAFRGVRNPYANIPKKSKVCVYFSSF